MTVKNRKGQTVLLEASGLDMRPLKYHNGTGSYMVTRSGFYDTISGGNPLDIIEIIHDPKAPQSPIPTPELSVNEQIRRKLWADAFLGTYGRLNDNNDRVSVANRALALYDQRFPN